MSKVKRICFFLGHYDPARQVIMEYYEKIFPKDIELFIACASPFDKEKYHLTRTKVFEFLDKKQIVPFKLRKFLKENEIDLVINLTGQAEVAITLFISTLLNKTKNVFYFLGNPGINLKNSFFLFYQFFTSGVWACCKEVSDKLKKILFFKKDQIFYLPFPIDVNLFDIKKRETLRKKLKFGQKEKILIYVGRIEPEQGSDYILELIEKNPDKRFLLIGQMRDENFKDKNFKNLTHIPYVKKSNLPDYYNSADLTLFLSKRNSYPYPPRESLACGIPVIVFNLETFGQLKTPAVTKVPFSVDEIQRGIDEVFSLSEKEREQLGREGRKFIVDDSSEEKLKEPTLNYFLGLLK